MSDNLRDRLAKVIWKVFQNTPPIDATDDEWESWWNDSTDADIRLIGEEKALFYAQADAVIDLLIDMAGRGELLRSIDRMHRDE